MQYIEYRILCVRCSIYCTNFQFSGHNELMKFRTIYWVYVKEIHKKRQGGRQVVSTQRANSIREQTCFKYANMDRKAFKRLHIYSRKQERASNLDMHNNLLFSKSNLYYKCLLIIGNGRALRSTISHQCTVPRVRSYRWKRENKSTRYSGKTSFHSTLRRFC